MAFASVGAGIPVSSRVGVSTCEDGNSCWVTKGASNDARLKDGPMLIILVSAICSLKPDPGCSGSSCL